MLRAHRSLGDAPLTVGGLLVPALVLCGWAVAWPKRSRIPWAGAAFGFGLGAAPLLLQWAPFGQNDDLAWLFIAGWLVLATASAAMPVMLRAWRSWRHAAIAMAAGILGHAALQADYLVGEAMPDWAWAPYAVLTAGVVIGVWATLRSA